MKPDEIREIINEPWLVNIVCALLAINQVYRGIGCANANAIGYVGHFYPILFFIVGFVVGLWPSILTKLRKLQGKTELDEITRLKLELTSYGFLIIGSVAILMVLFADTCNAINDDWPRVCFWR